MLVKLSLKHSDGSTEPIWVNPERVIWVQSQPGGTVVTIDAAGKKELLGVEGTADAVAKLLNVKAH